MKMHNLFLVVAASLFTVSGARAQIAVYDYRGSSTVLGSNSTSAFTAAGSLAIDLNTYQATYIGLLGSGIGRSRQVYFQETPLENFVITQIYGPRQQTYTVLAKAESPGTQHAGVILQSASAIGLNSNLTIKTLPTKLNWILPRSFKSTGLVLTADQNFDYLGQERGTYTLNTKMTTLWNNAGLTLAEYIAFVRNIHVNKGVQELVLPTATPTPTPTPTPTQSVGGIINSDTVWSDTSVIYAITSKVQVAYGATLTISPGVRVQNGTVEVFGRLMVEGTAQNPALLSGVNILPGSQSSARNFEIILRHAGITGGSVYSATGNGIYGTLTMEDSVVEDVGSYMYIWYPTSTVTIRRNIFSNCGSGNNAWIDGGSNGVDIVVENNVFKNCAPVVNWAAYSNAQMLVRYNTFLPANGATAVGFRPGYTLATMDARENYWGTTDETQIGTMIFDQNDDLGTSGVIPFKPFLTAPHPNTPVAP